VGRHLLLGSNGAGKTSVLESIYLLATTKSFRTPRLEECRRHGEDGFGIKGRVESSSRYDLETRWTPDGCRRLMNGNAVSSSRYLETLPVISWSAADLKVMDGSPGDRRRFLDQGVVAQRPASLEVLSRYRRCLEQKRELLRQGGRGLDVWNELLSQAGAELMNRRSAFVVELARCLEAIVETVEIDLPKVSLRYRPSLTLSETTAQNVLLALEAERQREIEQQRAVAGPHRDELEISWADVEISKIASAGEKKLFGILLCAARGRVLSDGGRPPVVLLDDVDAELDRERLVAVWKLFVSSPQIIASTCHEAVVDALPEVDVWALEQGSIGTSLIS